jgi:hypothetical protein
VNAGQVFLVAGNPVQCFRNNNLELAGLGITHEALPAKPVQRARPGNRAIIVDRDDAQSLVLANGAAERDLILD